MKRYQQLSKAECLARRYPFYDKKRNFWCYYVLNTCYCDENLEKLFQRVAGFEMSYRYVFDNEVVVRNTFSEVLEDMLVRDIDIRGFETDYNSQQLEWIGKIKKRLKEESRKEYIPSFCKKKKEWKCTIDFLNGKQEERGCIEYVMGEFSFYNEVYNYDVEKNPQESFCHAHTFGGLLTSIFYNKEFYIDNYKDQYSKQQIDLIEKLKKL